MAYASWKYIVDTRAGVQQGELIGCNTRQVIRALSGPSTAGFSIPVTTTLLSTLLTTDLNLRVYRNNLLLFHGPIISTELATDDATATPQVACTAADPSWRFDHRVAGKKNVWTAGQSGYLVNGVDPLTATETLIGHANSDGETGVQTLGLTVGGGVTATKLVTYQKLSEAIADLNSNLGGFDWRIDPIEYASGKIGQFRGAGVLGTTQTGAVFEYQGRGNARAPHYQRGIDTMVNKPYSITDDGPNSALGVRDIPADGVPAGATSTTRANASIAAHGLYEEVVDTSGVTNATLRDYILGDHIKYRAEPRQVLSFAPEFNDYSGRVPEYGVDYQIADFVRARVIYNQVPLVDGYVRLYKMQFDIDDNNKETLTPTVVTEA